MAIRRRTLLSAPLALAAPALLAKGTAAQSADALLAAARAEGEVMFYTALVETHARLIADAFTKATGVKAQFYRNSTAPVMQRYAAEADSGAIIADAVLSAGDVSAFMAEATSKGWVDRLDQSDLQALKAGDFPKAFDKGDVAVATVQLWVLGYNTDKVKTPPTEWTDLLKPEFKGQVIINDPSNSDAYVEFWTLLRDKFGDSFFEKLAAQSPRRYGLSAQAIQGLGAGEGAVMLPVTAAQVLGVKAGGAPLAYTTLGLTTGIEIPLFKTAAKRAKHPNAARLFCNWVLSPEGSKVVNQLPGSLGPYDKQTMPAQYEPPRAGAAGRKDATRKLLGFS